jgi:3-dehydroquinate dehydratase/shikimate dehydrogenase
LTGETLEKDLEVLSKYRRFVDIAELRVDCLSPDERYLIRKFPEMAGMPVILTIRRKSDGGHFSGGEWARIGLLSRGLAFADTDKRRNFAYIDMEEDINVPGIEEAARTFGTRIIRSYHNTSGVDEDIAGKVRGLRRMGDELVKVAVTPQSLDDTVRVFKAAKETAGLDKILICMGHFGVSTRILAELLGSQITYASVKNEAGFPPAAPGQLDPIELFEFYRFKSITSKTRVFGITGYPLTTTLSPAFFNAVFALENFDAVYVPFPAVSIQSFLQLAEEIGLQGASVTIPHKEKVVPYLAQQSEKVKAIGSCNTIVREEGGWHGYNTDAQGFSDSLLAFMGKKNLRGKKITIIGAGGVARAVAEEVYRLKAKALILNRTPLRAYDLAEPYKFRWAGFDASGLPLMDRFNDIIIQTTSVGMAPDVDKDPIEMYKFSGKEAVMDVIYKPEMTNMLKRAERTGCRVLNGYDMFLRQAQFQYNFFTGREFPSQLMSRIDLFGSGRLN